MNSVQRVGVLFLGAVSLLVFLALVGSGYAVEMDLDILDKSNFDDSATIDNEWFPLKPGTRFVWDGSAIDTEGDEEPHRVVFTVTDLTKVISGVRSLICWDQDFVDGELEETETVFFAQDKDGAVWHLGQYPEEYEEGEIMATPGWLHGVRDGKAGIYMPANPKLGDPSFPQGWAPSVPWTDRAVVYQAGVKVQVPHGTFEDVLVFDETSKEEPNAHALKYYARGVGIVRVGSMGEGDKESLELIRVEQLDAAEFAKAREEALQLDERSRKNVTEVFAHSQPVELNGQPVAARQATPQAAKADPQVRKISDEQARKIALETVPGEVMAVDVERKLGAERIVVEVIAEDGREIDVIIDMESGKVLATEA